MFGVIVGVGGLVVGYLSLTEARRGNEIASQGILQSKIGNLTGIASLVITIISAIAMIYFFMPDKEKEYDVNNYYDDGILHFIGNGTLENKEDIWKWYSENGILIKYETYDDNILDGEYKEFYDNGNLKVQGEYDNGKKNLEEWSCYNREGTVKECNTKKVTITQEEKQEEQGFIDDILAFFSESFQSILNFFTDTVPSFFSKLFTKVSNLFT